MKKTILLLGLVMLSFNSKAQNQTIDGTLTVKSASDAITTFQTLDDKWLYTQWKNKSGVRKAYMGFNANLTNFILGLENGANKFSVNNGDVYLNGGTLNAKSKSDAIATFQTLDDKWLYTQWKNKSGVRKAYMGFDASLTNFILGLENGANKFSVNNGDVYLNGGTLNAKSKSDAIATFQTLDDKWLYTQWKNKAGVRKAYMGFNANLTNFILGLENGAKKFLIPNGKVGIGTNNTGSHKLAVEGSIGAREIMVEASGWSDFVFETDYNLPTLVEVENHIKEKGHLKDIPSAKEVMKNGISLGKMDAKLLQKIEELTLYIIQQQKEIKEQANEIKELKSVSNRLSELEKLIENKK